MNIEGTKATAQKIVDVCEQIERSEYALQQIRRQDSSMQIAISVPDDDLVIDLGDDDVDDEANALHVCFGPVHKLWLIEKMENEIADLRGVLQALQTKGALQVKSHNER